jgi:quinoprotein glucose dehydrogenase
MEQKMSRKVLQIVPALALLAVGLVWVAPNAQGQATSMPSTKNGDWPNFTADLNGDKYSPMAQIDASNFSKMEIAWRLKTDNFGPRPENKLEGTPLEVRGTVYATAGTRKSVVALDAKTGELKWTYGLDEGARAQWSPRQLSGRGLAYWTDGRGDERILYTTIGYQLVELNAKTGAPVASFGKNGVLDLKVGVMYGKQDPKTLKFVQTQIDLEKGEIGWHSAPTIVGDMVLVGSSMAEGLGYTFSANSKGLARAFDVKTGKLIWKFNTMPGPGEFGHESWMENSWDWTGNTGVWTQISVDPEAGLVYLPVETPTIDEYGGNRPGNDLFAESIVAVDMKTGIRKWHFQQVHHGLWDHDNSSASLLVDATIDGRPRKIIAQPTKQSYLYVLDRITGEPIWPIPEKPVPQTDVPGEWTSPTQPIPTKPPAYSRPFLAPEDLIDFTPQLHQQALDNLKAYRWEQTPFIPPAWQGPNKKWNGSINMGTTVGGVNWPGSGFDPETAIFYTQANNSSVNTSNIGQAFWDQVNPDAQKSHLSKWDAQPTLGGGRGAGRGPAAADAAPADAAAGGGRGGRGGGRGGAAGAPAAAGAAPAAGAAAPQAAAAAGGGRGGGLNAGLNGLPIVKPPYGVVSAIDLNKGELKWQVPSGDTPDNVRAALQQMGINYPGKMGQGSSVGILVTKTLVVVGDSQLTTTPEHPRGAMLRAYDKQTGKEVGAVLMPAAQSGSPMTYSVDGKQYIIVAISGGNYTGEYLAFSLPGNGRGN